MMKILGYSIRFNYAALLFLVLFSGASIAGERMDVTERKNTTRDVTTPDGGSRTVRINPADGKLWEDIVAIPERVMAIANAPMPLDDDNEAPDGLPTICCYALVMESGEVLAINPNTGSINVFQTVEAYKELFYYESHYVLPINENTGIYDESPVVVFDSDIETTASARSDECDMTAMVGGFTTLPTQCSAPVLHVDDYIGTNTPINAVSGRYFISSMRAAASTCLEDTLSVPPWTVNLRFEPVVIETTCNISYGNYPFGASAALRNRIAGRYSRSGLGTSVPFSAIMRSDDLAGAYNDAFFIPPQVPSDANAQHRVQPLIAIDEPFVSSMNTGEAGVATASGAWELAANGASMQFWMLYSGPARDNLTFCAHTDIFGDDLEEEGSINGFYFNREIEVQQADTSYPIESAYVQSKNLTHRCDIAYKSIHNIETAYLVPSLGSVFMFQVNAGGNRIDLRVPDVIETTYQSEFWRAYNVDIGPLPEMPTPSYILTNIVAK